MKRLFPFVYAVSCLISAHLFAGSATWNLNPTSGDWNTSENWTPATVPNGPFDVATFAASTVNQVSFSESSTEVAEVIFDSNATSSFNLTIGGGRFFNISGPGVVNNSGVAQNFSIGTDYSSSVLFFQNTATAGTSDVTYTASSADTFHYNQVYFLANSTAGSANFVAWGASHGVDVGGGLFLFYDNSTAGNSTFTINGATTKNSYGGSALFDGFATAGNATFVLNPGTKDDFDPGHMTFRGSSTAGDGVFTLNGAIVSGSYPEISFTDAATAGNGFFTVMGGHRSSGGGGVLSFYGFDFTGLITTAGSATMIVEGGTTSGASGGIVGFSDASTAGQALIVAHGGENGGVPGRIQFFSDSDGGEAQIEVYDDGFLDISFRFSGGVTIGSLAGDGLVYLGSQNLTVGSNDLDTTFSGIMQENGGFTNGSNGSLSKIGTGTLTLKGASTYKGGTTVTDGVLRIKNTTGSGTGTGAVLVNTGTLGGSGIISGVVTVGTGSGTGAFLVPAVGASVPTTLTAEQGVTFKGDGTYTYKLNTKKAKGDQVIADGVTIKAGAQFEFRAVAKKKLATGLVFTAISNTATTQISGTFANLADGSIVTIGKNKLQVSYSGGDGNDLTLTVLP